MTKKLLSLLLIAISLDVYGQAPLPVAGNLMLHLEAGSGYNVNSTTPDVWHDKSGQGNDVSVLPGNPNPAFIPNSFGTGFPAVRFSGGEFMESAFPANGWDAADNVTAATLFVVRIANPAVTMPHMMATGPGAVHTLLSICQDRVYNEEFLMATNTGVHHSFNGHFFYKAHQCYSFLPANRPVVLSTVLRRGTNTTTDIDYYVNNILSTTAAVTTASPPISNLPTAYNPVDRMIVVGARYDNNSSPQEFFQGDIMEILAYNRQLNTTEVRQVNEWLQIKYGAGYSMSPCNNPTNTTTNCFDAANMSVVYMGNNINGDCMFQADLVTSTVPGYSNLSTEWQLGAGTWTTTPTFAFTLPAGTPPTALRGNSYFTASPGISPYCCDISLQRQVQCQSGTGLVFP